MIARLRRIALTAATTLALTVAGIFVLGEFYDLSAVRQHPGWVFRGVGLARDAIVAVDASDVEVPPGWAPEATPAGAALFQEHCAQCHGAPGIAPADFALSMMPVPSNLVAAARERPPEEVFWFIRNGLKMSGMPAWAIRLDEAEMWRLTALVEALPALSPVAYKALLPEVGAAPEDGVPKDGAPLPEGATGGAGADVLTGADALVGGDPERGRRAMALHACRSCHLIPGLVGRPDLRVGPPLGDVAERSYIAGVLPNRPENMIRWLMDPQEVDPLSAMPDLGVSEPVARDMAAYLYGLADE